tara:strand:- start:429 stop:701 length:273 start_codon:yes stop_codon:yes gene_type:complete
MVIIKRSQPVYVCTERGRAYLTLDAAINAEAKAIIYKHYPKIFDSDDHCEFVDFDIQEARPEYYLRRFNQIVKILKHQVKCKGDNNEDNI